MVNWRGLVVEICGFSVKCSRRVRLPRLFRLAWETVPEIFKIRRPSSLHNMKIPPEYVLGRSEDLNVPDPVYPPNRSIDGFDANFVLSRILNCLQRHRGQSPSNDWYVRPEESDRAGVV